jgi:hypothetical protein
MEDVVAPWSLWPSRKNRRSERSHEHWAGGVCMPGFESWRWSRWTIWHCGLQLTCYKMSVLGWITSSVIDSSPRVSLCLLRSFYSTGFSSYSFQGWVLYLWSGFHLSSSRPHQIVIFCKKNWEHLLLWAQVQYDMGRRKDCFWERYLKGSNSTSTHLQ